MDVTHAAPSQEDSVSDPLEIIARFHYRHEADFARQVLEDAGIPAALQIDDAGGIEMGMAFVNPARLRVRAEDAVRARDVLTGAGLLDEDEASDRAEGS